MAFFSGNCRGGGGGIFGRSLLPSTSSHSKPSCSSCRRRPLRDLLPCSYSTSVFALGLSLSLLAVVLRYGVPSPLHLHPRSHRSFSPRLTRHPNIRHSSLNLDLSASDSAAAASKIASVDITTKDLYDRIEFLDIDGGPWKQGWHVNYVGNEWDDEKLKVFVVPHSHNDPEWKLTVEEYYERQSRHILDTIIESLSRDERRKFIWEEMSYLERWWRDSSSSMRERFVKLVKDGRLEIVGGGWVMNDEVKSRFLFQ